MSRDVPDLDTNLQAGLPAGLTGAESSDEVGLALLEMTRQARGTQSLTASFDTHAWSVSATGQLRVKPLTNVATAYVELQSA